MTEFCDQSYSEGYKAYLRGEPSDANPYPPGSKQHVNWRAGWADLALIAALTVKQEE